MIEESADFRASKRPCKPLHVVLHEDLHGCAVDRACTLDRHAHATTDGHVRAEKKPATRRIGEGGVPPSRRFIFHHIQNRLGCQSGFFRLPSPAYSKSLYIGISNTPGPFMSRRRLKSSLSSRKWMSPWPSMLKRAPAASK